MDRSDFYSGQVVSQLDMDEAFDDVEEAEFALAKAGGIAQVDVALSPGPDVFGGITEGLDVTGVLGSDHVTVDIGVARDNTGAKISLGTSATVMMTKAGSTPEGDVALAIPTSGADISASCVVGRRIVATLSIVYDEALSDYEQDETGTWAYYRLEESFHFLIEIGASFPIGAAPVAPPFAALTNGKVVLTDILLENLTGTITVAAVYPTSASWDALGGNYALWPGRRSDHFVAEIDDSNLPLQTVAIRNDSDRGALYTLMEQLQESGVTAGTDVIGAPARVGPAIGSVFVAATPLSVPAGTLTAQQGTVVDAFSTMLFNGGGSTLRPQAGVSGITFDPSSMDANRTGFPIKSLADAGAANIFQIGKKRGHVALPHVFYEDWLNRGGVPSGVFLGETVVDLTVSAWIFTHSGIGNGELLYVPGGEGGIVNLHGSSGKDELYSHVSSGGQVYAGWYLYDIPWCIAQWRVYLPSVANLQVSFALWDTINSGLAWGLDTALGPELRLWATDSGGTTVTDTSYTPFPGLTWLTVRAAVVANNKVAWQINNGPEVIQTLTAPGIFSSNPHINYIAAATTAGAPFDAYMDEVMVMSGQLPADKY